MSDHIELLGVQTHNLKNIDVQIQRNKFTVITGVSGSGKSSLAFTTLCNEGQRRYMESLSTYARMFLGGSGEEAEVREVSGITPTISIDQKTVSHNPRSTVGTITEIYDFYRLLYLHIGVQYCPDCDEPLRKNTRQDVYEFLAKQKEGTKAYVLFELDSQFEQFAAIKEYVARIGFIRFMIWDEVFSLSDESDMQISPGQKVYVVIDRLVLKDLESADLRKRIFDSIELSFEKWEEVMSVYVVDNKGLHTFSQRNICSGCGYTPPKLTLSHFSFNSPHGACSDCNGLGYKISFIEDAITNPDLALSDGALLPWSSSKYYMSIVEEIAGKYDIPLNVPYTKLTKKHRNILLQGTEDKVQLQYKNSSGSMESWSANFPGLIPFLERKYKEQENSQWARDMASFATHIDCPDCDGHRLNTDSLLVRIGGKNIGEVTALNVDTSLEFFSSLKLSDTNQQVADKVLKNVRERLTFLQRVGLSYITLSRRSNTLSGGEGQRIRLATQVGSKLEGITYVLDEPSIGLHPRDNGLLIENLKELTGIGNTLVVVEHDDEIMRAADEIIDIGPAAGVHGGEIVFQGTFDQMMKSGTQTAEYLAGQRSVQLPANKRKATKKLKLTGASENNLQNVDVEIPLGLFTCVTGVSGSGKSSLINKTLAPILLGQLNRANTTPGAHKSITWVDSLDKAIVINQMPIGKTPRSNPATYTGVFTAVREVFSTTNEAKKRGYKSGHFSFNTRQGRCEVCEGDGTKKIEMHFMPDMHVKCESCQGSRFNDQVSEVEFKWKNIAQVLDMTVEEGLDFFDKFPRIKRVLETLNNVGLGYIKLGQSATTLSGGESQRVKLATELAKRSTSKTIYILDEPTTGLHFSDIQRLLDILDSLVEKGNTVVVIEHNLDVVANADHIIDIGPEGGDGGGQIVYSGSRDKMLSQDSHTANSLREYLTKK